MIRQPGFCSRSSPQMNLPPGAQGAPEPGRDGQRLWVVGCGGGGALGARRLGSGSSWARGKAQGRLRLGWRQGGGRQALGPGRAVPPAVHAPAFELAAGAARCRASPSSSLPSRTSPPRGQRRMGLKRLKRWWRSGSTLQWEERERGGGGGDMVGEGHGQAAARGRQRERAAAARLHSTAGVQQRDDWLQGARLAGGEQGRRCSAGSGGVGRPRPRSPAAAAMPALPPAAPANIPAHRVTGSLLPLPLNFAASTCVHVREQRPP